MHATIVVDRTIILYARCTDNCL